ncbi:MAG: hypothetical protein JWM87_339, partial [Candidatus Eremiobacteraeota bacterium]|nr:hypothetical protein [Candidatus Eremiobacteraeota bacterium]
PAAAPLLPELGPYARLARNHRRRMRSAAMPAHDARPLVSVVLVHHERPTLARRALASLRAQSYENVEIVLVDDGSTGADALAFLDELEAQPPRGLRVVRQPNLYVGAARNNGARAARGEFLLFMDDDNVALGAQIEIMVRAALATPADIVTYVPLHEEVDRDERVIARGHRYFPIGGGIAGGVVRNVFGDANALVRRTVFDALGGFGTQRRAVDDWQFFLRAVAHGHTIAVVPDSLAVYRFSAWAMFAMSEPVENHLHVLRAIASAPFGELDGLADLIAMPVAHEPGARFSADARLALRPAAHLWERLQHASGADAARILRALAGELRLSNVTVAAPGGGAAHAAVSGS